MLKKWDLDGIVIDKGILITKSDYLSNMSVLLYYVIGYLFYNTELYTRQSFLGNEYYFTTNEELYQLTGIYAISFEDGKNSGVYSRIFSTYYMFNSIKTSSRFDINKITNIVIYGNLDILNNYGLACSMIYRESKSIHLRLLEGDDGLIEGQSSFDLNMGLFISDFVECSEKKLIYLSSSNISLSTYYDLLIYRIRNSLIEIDNKINKDLIINSYPLNKLSSFPFDICDYLNSVTLSFSESDLISIDKDIEKLGYLSSFVLQIKELGLTNFKFGFRHDIQVDDSSYILSKSLDDILCSYLNDSFNGRRFGDVRTMKFNKSIYKDLLIDLDILKYS